ncbi:MAG: amphi-Trp domain-containing protein [Chloroflexaceae bacterium]|nr:amphi-Trp domain-containing protein [Chloroflexaceae bacterium]
MAHEIKLCVEKHITSRAAIVRRLRELADRIESRSFFVGDYAINLPDQVDFELEYDQKTGDSPASKLEIELHWSPWEQMGPTGMLSAIPDEQSDS